MNTLATKLTGIRGARCSSFCVAGVLWILAAVGAHAGDGESMRLAADQLVRAQLPSGLFRYDFDFLTGTESTGMSSQNLVRQAGTAYVLAQYHGRAPGDRLRRAVENAIEGFRQLSLPITRTGLQHAIQRTRVLSLSFGRRTMQSLLNEYGLLYSPEDDGKIVSPDGGYEVVREEP